MDKIRSASVPHIKFEYPRKPFPHFSIHTRIMQCGWQHSGKFALSFTLLIIGSILVPYTIKLAKGDPKPLLPSFDLFTEPNPYHGIFSLALFFTALIGYVMISIRYVHVASLNESKSWRINVLNKLGIMSGIVSFSGLIIIAAFPSLPPSPEMNQFTWTSSVVLPHMLGAFFAFFFGALYILLQTAMSLLYCGGEGNSRIITLLRFVLFMLCAICFATSSITTLPVEKSDASGKIITTDIMIKSIKNKNLEFTSGICEWLLVFFYALYFLTFIKESQRISVVLTFRHLITGRRISIASISNVSKI